MSHEDNEQRIDEVLESQHKYIKEHFGEEAEAAANYGWGVDEVDREVQTKVYGHGILCTSFDSPDDHEFDTSYYERRSK